MTRCNEENFDINLKSSVYNQTGQNYFQQLSAYNAMSSHLCRVLQAKSVVNTKNSDYIRNKRYRYKTDYRSRSLERNLSLDIIDKLAYDTEHHPCDILRMNENLKHRCVKESRNPHQSRYDSWNAHCSHSQICTNQTYSENARKYTNCTSKSKKKTGSPSPNHEPLTYWSDRHRRCFEEPAYSKEIGFSNPKRSTWKYQNQTCHRPLPKKSRYENEQVCHACASSFEFSSDASDSETPKLDTTNVSSTVTPEQCIEGNVQKNNEQVIEASLIKKITSGREDETKYIKFVYDITKEIMQYGLYTDEDIQDVFKKYIERNKGTLNKSKMLQEIRRLKISLNMIDESDEDEDEDYLLTNRFSTSSDPKPPTPPKVLNENKVIEKLQNYKKLLETQRNSIITSTSNKSVVLIDANPELLVTEQDVLSTLMEMNLDPKQAQSICKNLYYKSRDTSLCQMVQAKASTFKYSDKNLNTNLILQKDQVIQTQIQDPKPKVYPRTKVQCNCKTKTVLSQPTQTQKIRCSNEKSINHTLIENSTTKEIPSSKELLTNTIEPDLTPFPINRRLGLEFNFGLTQNLNESVQTDTTMIDDQSRTAMNSNVSVKSQENEDTVKTDDINKIFNECVRYTSDVAPIKSIQQEPNVDEHIKELTVTEQMVEDHEENSIDSIVESIQENFDISDDTLNKISTSDAKQIGTDQDSNTNTEINSNNTDKSNVESEVNILQDKRQSVPTQQDLIEEFINSETNLAPIWESDEESNLEANEVTSESECETCSDTEK